MSQQNNTSITGKLVCAPVPTRKPPQNIRRLMDSMLNQADDPSRIEFILRIDYDYEPMISSIPDLGRAYDGFVRFVVGPRYLGYSSFGVFFSEMSAMTDATWLFHTDDDVEIKGRGWDTKLAQVPDDLKSWASSQFYCLNQSRYECVQPVGPFVSNRFFRTALGGKITHPVDSSFFGKHTEEGCKCHILTGVEYHHHWHE